MAMDTSQLAFPKGKKRRSLKAKATRQEATVKQSVRWQVIGRDGACRLCWARYFDVIPRSVWTTDPVEAGKFTEWAHLHSHRRSQTRGQAAEKRHTTAGSLMLCRYHHAEYDAHRLLITCLTRRGADGPLRFRKAKS